MSKSDGMIRRFAQVVPAPAIKSATASNGTVTIAWASVSNFPYRVQFKTSLTNASWTNLAGDVLATGPSASKSDTAGDEMR